jgi:hypothetical protein
MAGNFRLKIWLRGDGHYMLAAVDATACRELHASRSRSQPTRMRDPDFHAIISAG